MKISVIIPSYKPQDYLWECLESLCAQSFTKEDFEVILVLNGCTEPYKTKIEHYLAKRMQGMKINFIHTEKGGVSNARNLGLDVARGEYIIFVDDDDLVSNNYLEELYKVSNPTCVGCANSYAFRSDISELVSNFITNAYIKCKICTFNFYNYRQFLSPPWCKLIHRELIKDTRFSVKLKKSEDSLFCMELTTRIKNMCLAESTAIYYQRMRLGSAMRTKRSFTTELKEHFLVECAYIKLWLKQPLKYNFKFFISRLFACMKNFIIYINS